MIQQLHKTLPEAYSPSDRASVFTLALMKLDAYFQLKRNEPFERHKFHKMVQESESIAHYCSGLRQQVKFCGFVYIKVRS